MTDTVYNISKLALANNDLDLDGTVSDIRGLLLQTVGAGYDNPDLDSVAAVLAVGGTTTTTPDERVAASSRVTEVDDTNDRANVTAPTSPMFAFDAVAGEDAVGVLIYLHVDGTDANDVPIAVQDFASVPLDGGLDLDPSDANADWLRIV
jgi:hypothetical protein